MGGGTWTKKDFSAYATTKYGLTADEFATTSFTSTQTIYENRSLHSSLNPYNVMRECCDSEEHPNTLPVILALDVTGSMGQAAIKVAQALNEIVTNLYDTVEDVEFCIMGIGDLAYDSAPIQISQFESDIRIAEALDKIYFEGGGGGNMYESYTAAWYMGLNHCKLDCWNRGKKGIIITMGDERPNPYLPQHSLQRCTGDNLQGSVETDSLYEEAIKKFDIYHISVNDPASCYTRYNESYDIDGYWKNLLGNHYYVTNLNSLAPTISDIINKTGITQETQVEEEVDEVIW